MQGEYIVALENTPTLQNVIVCTLCSCTAWPVLGLPPDWYKSFEYRARVVREARTVLREMGLDLPEAVASRVWDTTAETRDMVLPVRPEGPRGGARRHLLGNTAGFDATGHPAMSIPCACDEGLPIGLQLVGRYFAEADIYCAAHAFEQTTDRPDPAPAL